jgi:hypothetical protein
MKGHRYGEEDMNKASSDPGAKRPYHKPVFVAYGDVRTVTLNTSPQSGQFSEDFSRAGRRGEETRGGRRNRD